VGVRLRSDIGGDVPDWDNAESRESDEDAAWRDLVARFEDPTATSGPAPWPERENVLRPQDSLGADGTDGTPEVQGSDGTGGTGGTSGTDGVGGSGGTDGAGGTGGRQGGIGAGESQELAGSGDQRGVDDIKEAQGTPAVGDLDGTGGVRGAEGSRGARDSGDARGAEGIRGFDDEGARGAFGADGGRGAGGGRGADGGPGTHEPDVIQASRRDRGAVADGIRARRIRARRAPPRPVPEDDQEHFIPPTPPPLPKLDPITKGAWAALFGGPGYLVVATVVGWSVPGIAAFCAVAAFVTGFAILVLRMNESSGPGRGGPDDGDDGAVV
jgi:hypothetical protein